MCSNPTRILQSEVKVQDNQPPKWKVHEEIGQQNAYAIALSGEGGSTSGITMRYGALYGLPDT